MRASMAYLGGAGTVIVAIAMGLGGGLLMGNIMNPHEGREIGKVEQRRAGPQQAQQSQPCVLADLLADARAQAQKLAEAAGLGAGR